MTKENRKAQELDGYELLMKINLENTSMEQEELSIYFSPGEFMYKVYNEENKLLSKIDISLRYIWVDKLSELISGETKKFIKNKKLGQLLSDGK